MHHESLVDHTMRQPYISQILDGIDYIGSGTVGGASTRAQANEFSVVEDGSTRPLKSSLAPILTPHHHVIFYDLASAP